MEMTRVFVDGHLRNASFTVAESIFSNRFATFMSHEIYAALKSGAKVNASAVRFGEWARNPIAADKTDP